MNSIPSAPFDPESKLPSYEESQNENRNFIKQLYKLTFDCANKEWLDLVNGKYIELNSRQRYSDFIKRVHDFIIKAKSKHHNNSPEGERIDDDTRENNHKFYRNHIIISSVCDIISTACNLVSTIFLCCFSGNQQMNVRISNRSEESNTPNASLVFFSFILCFAIIFFPFFSLYKARTEKLEKSDESLKYSLFACTTSALSVSTYISFACGAIVKEPQKYCSINNANWLLMNFVLVTLSAALIICSVSSVLISADKLNAKEQVLDLINENNSKPDPLSRLSNFITSINPFSTSESKRPQMI